MFKATLAALALAFGLIAPQMVNDRLTGTTPPASNVNPINASRLPSGNTALPEAVWNSAGAAITNRTTQCGATVTLGGTASTNTTNINNAINSCTAGQYVQLPAGTYNYNGFQFDGKSNVTLRGAGPGSGGTTLVLASDFSCRGYGSFGCVINNNSSTDFVPDNPVNVSDWTAGYAKGTTTITLSARILGSSAPAVGKILHLDQLDDTTDLWTDVWNCQSSSNNCSDEGGDGGRTGRGQTESFAITNVTGTGPYTITISPGIQMPNWRSAKSPQAHWGNDLAITGVGIENIGFDISNLATQCNPDLGGSPASNRGLVFFNATNSWVQNVRVYKPCRDHILFFQSINNTVRNSYFYEGHSHQSQSYGMEMFVGARNLIENNIFQRVAAPFIVNSGMGNVAFANYQLDDGYDNPTTFMQAGCQHHAASADFTLCEQNDFLGVKGDVIHGTQSFNTAFRNFLRGWFTGETNETNPVKIYANNRFWSIVGNVLGTSTYHNTYSADSSTSIYALGSASIDGTPPSDSHVAESVFLWGNYDTVTGAVRWCGNSGNTGWSTTCSSTSEVPTGLSLYSNSVPSTETLPNSLFRSSAPTYWGSVPWPAIGSDVTGGDISNVGGHVYKIPARRCYEAGSKDVNNFLTNFDGSTGGVCY